MIFYASPEMAFGCGLKALAPYLGHMFPAMPFYCSPPTLATMLCCVVFVEHG
jgi:hypothetical protein